MQNTQTQTQIQPGHYDLDPQRSVIRFRTRHLFGLGPVGGTFALRSGAVSVTDPLDGSTFAQSRIFAIAFPRSSKAKSPS